MCLVVFTVQHTSRLVIFILKGRWQKHCKRCTVDAGEEFAGWTQHEHSGWMLGSLRGTNALGPIHDATSFKTVIYVSDTFRQKHCEWHRDAAEEQVGWTQRKGLNPTQRAEPNAKGWTQSKHKCWDPGFVPKLLLLHIPGVLLLLLPEWRKVRKGKATTVILLDYTDKGKCILDAVPDLLRDVRILPVSHWMLCSRRDRPWTDKSTTALHSQPLPPPPPPPPPPPQTPFLHSTNFTLIIKINSFFSSALTTWSFFKIYFSCLKITQSQHHQQHASASNKFCEACIWHSSVSSRYATACMNSLVWQAGMQLPRFTTG